MGKYTVLGDQAIELMIAEELSRIVSRLRELVLSAPRSLLLVGGFGKGEGSFLRDSAGCRPLNDYDLIFVTNGVEGCKPICESEHSALERDLAGIVSVKQVDLKFVAPHILRIPVPTVERYESSRGHQVLCGKRPMMAGWPGRLLPLCEGTRYLRNRAMGLLLAYLILGGEGRWDERQKHELAFLEINKAFLATGDAWLIAAREYHYLYSERLARVRRGVAGSLLPAAVQASYVAAAEARLYGWDPDRQPSPVSDTWLVAADQIAAEFLRFERFRLLHPFRTLEEYRRFQLETKSCSRTKRSWIRGLKSSIDGTAAAQQMVEALTILGHLVSAGGPGRNAGGERLAHVLRAARASVSRWHPHGVVAALPPSQAEA